ncbi:hypothetical protein CYLTODRAFT_425006 [Cylindrobasidium torrendii FP15055 ss-10]|uniref:F-box domain-containing protein n=1 Tax=Cylindrobasidium torrendii FP15055 ss-10 TaxID=1314674 RepID=A0A0D7B2B5_9AGAR|nr:hypothetical protein CYLTODRAFT_425006 [Cylindrobasidium torrendii FP15055 ss-10]
MMAAALQLRFDMLPVEIAGVILAFLTFEDLVSACLVNKQVYSIIQESSRLQYILDLARFRMVANYESKTPYVKRLEALRKREAAWRTLTWQRRHRLLLPAVASIYEFVGGIYGNGRDHDRQDPIPGISFFQLPYGGLDEQPTYKMWSFPFPDLDIRDFTIDPSQDLLVLITSCEASSPYIFEMHLRTLSTNEPHPDVAATRLPCFAKDLLNAPLSNNAGAIRIQVSGGLIGFLMKEMDTIEVWNIASGFCSSFVLPSGIEDFTFITQTSFLIVRPSGFLEAYEFSEPAEHSPPPKLLGSFSFPPLAEGPMFWHSTLSLNPAPGYYPSSARNSYTNDEYFPNPKERVIACCVYIVDATQDPLRPQVFSFVFFFPISIFIPKHPKSVLDLCTNEPPPEGTSASPTDTIFFSTYSASSVDASQPHHPTATNMYPVPWDAWGPPNTRWFRECLVTDWQHALHGMRTVESITAKVWKGQPKETMEVALVDEIDNEGEEDCVDPGADVVVDYGATIEPASPDLMPVLIPSRRFLRIRDYNPCVVRMVEEQLGGRSGKMETGPMRTWKVCREPSVCKAQGAFKDDITSSLPYVESVSRSAFDMTDVMMDDCRVLLLKRTRGGRLLGIDVLTM